MDIRGILARTRLVTGVTMSVFLTTHLATHCVGLVSLPALQAANEVFLAVWRSALLSWVVPTFLFVHTGLALYAVADRRSLRMRRGEAFQLVSGLVMPIFLLPHMAMTRGLYTFDGVTVGYRHMFLYDLSTTLVLQWTLMAIAWGHMCLGLHLYLRHKSWYGRVRPFAAPVALVLPVIACLAALNIGRDATRAAQNPEWLAQTVAKLPGGLAGLDKRTHELFEPAMAVYLALLGLAFAVRLVRKLWVARSQTFEISYASGERVKVAAGTTLLEASRAAGVPHASVCGGRGRCSTCRVRVISGGDNAPKALLQEQRVLQRVGAPPGVRLACQTRPTGPMQIAPLLQTASVADGAKSASYLAGVERDIVVMFADLRGFTAFSEKRLPYDVVYVLNQYFESMEDAVRANGGIVDKFIGDCVMALFGVETELPPAARGALQAAQEMSERLALLNQQLAHELSSPLQMGIGLHCGPAIVGRVGSRQSGGVTAIGDTVNTASRLEAMTKELRCELIVSKAVVDATGAVFRGLPVEEVKARGKTDGILVHPIAAARDLGQKEAA